MEPMSLGSPIGSPAQPANSPGPGSNFLPGFLLGDTNPRIGVMSPESNRYSHMHGTPSTPLGGYATPELRMNRQKAMFASGSNPSLSQIAPENHANGPPTKSLYDSLDTKQTMSTPQSVTLNNQSFNHSRVLGSGFANTTVNAPYCETPINQTQNESTQGLLQWITVFGFPMAALNIVLSHISSRVRIIDKHPAPHSQSNWIHLKCSSDQEAQRALACNGNIVSGSVMIGVIPCTDEGVILGTDKENRSKLSESMRMFSTPVKAGHMTGVGANKTPVRIPNARPLVSGYNQHMSPQAVRSPDNVPHKSTGLVTKAMEYVFGW
ncbi:nucleoporin NUP53 [Trichogramma pretiosum]|uniref:nucleoporin NUP53 n=1 Tax=Trichogramma pretiosum TaxID=7493 RepID=UPI0006C9A134|nr:nucleoporin NUP53 [Trichogramma pretiosum]